MCCRGVGWTAVPCGWTLGCSCAMSNHDSCACAGMLLLTHGTHWHLSRVRACLAGAPRTPSHLVHAVRWRRKTRLCGSSASAVASSRLCLPQLWLAAVDQLHSSECLWYTAPAMHAATVSRLWCTLRTCKLSQSETILQLSLRDPTPVCPPPNKVTDTR